MRLAKSLIFGLLLVSMTLLVFPAIAAIGPVDCGNWGIACDGSAGAVHSYLQAIINLFLSLVSLVAIVFIIIGGVRYIASQGDPKETEKAKHTVMYAVIGLILIGICAVLVNFVISAVQG